MGGNILSNIYQISNDFTERCMKSSVGWCISMLLPFYDRLKFTQVGKH